jgi:hypothetical protein
VGDVGGAEILRDARGRRIGERDRWGGRVARLAWADDGALAEGALRLPDGGWLVIEPRAMRDPRWGLSDVLRREGDAVPLTHFATVDWAAIEAIPPLAEPTRLPAGAGTAVLNLIAALAADQGRAGLPYRGPYPTEQLFTALLEAFRWEGDVTDEGPLAAFMAGGLTWSPAPFARAFTPEGACVQSRQRVEKVVWRGRTYTRADWQGVERHAAHRVHDADGRVHCALWALGAPLESHLILSLDGEVVATQDPEPVGTRESVAAEIIAGLVAVVVASSAPALAGALRAVAAQMTFAWSPLAGDLVEIGDTHAHLAQAMPAALCARVTAAGSRVEQVRLGFAALAELAAAAGDALRGRAQLRLAADTAPAQAEVLGAARSPEEAAASARDIGRAVEALLETAAVSGWRER